MQEEAGDTFEQALQVQPTATAHQLQHLQQCHYLHHLPDPSASTSGTDAAGLPPPAKLTRVSEIPNATVQLLDKELWDAFYEITNEMIVTKLGRRVFPQFSVLISDLDDATRYSVTLRFTQVDEWRYRYVERGWRTNGLSDAPHDETRMLFEHPGNPAPGELWMKKPIAFKRLKITHYPQSTRGQVLLHTMHRYRIDVLIKNMSVPDGEPSVQAVEFPETTFTAVTTYQNSEVTRLKVANNPFAKGFKDREIYLQTHPIVPPIPIIQPHPSFYSFSAPTYGPSPALFPPQYNYYAPLYPSMATPQVFPSNSSQPIVSPAAVPNPTLMSPTGPSYQFQLQPLPSKEEESQEEYDEEQS